MKKTAFTMMELIIVIVIAGILAAVMMPRLERDSLREVTNQVLRHVQYTQHLAMVDDVYDAGQANWERALWSVNFRSNNCYAIQSDSDLSGGQSRSESAIDPLTGLRLYSNTGCTYNSADNKELLLADTYNATIGLSAGCGTNLYIAFDNLGRPLKTRNISDPIVSGSSCDITISSSGRNSVITIEPETGYTHITSFDN